MATQITHHGECILIILAEKLCITKERAVCGNC